MKKLFRLVLFGFLSWLVTFGASVCLFFIKKHNEHLFETLMGIVLTICTVAFTLIYFHKIQAAFFREGILLGLAFIGCNVLFDLPMFSYGPMAMPLHQYMTDIGLGYLSMGVISAGFGSALQKVRHE
jgi:hypothetical protein